MSVVLKGNHFRIFNIWLTEGNRSLIVLDQASTKKGNIASTWDLWLPTNSVVSFRLLQRGCAMISFRLLWEPRCLYHSSCRRQPLLSWREFPWVGSGLCLCLCICAHSLTLDSFFLCLPEKAWLPNQWVCSEPTGQERPYLNYRIRVGAAWCHTEHFLQRERYLGKPRCILLLI